jgi:hypothetical protein
MYNKLIIILLVLCSCTTKYLKIEDLPNTTNFFNAEERFSTTPDELWLFTPAYPCEDVQSRLTSNYTNKEVKVIGIINVNASSFSCPSESQRHAQYYVAELKGYGYVFGNTNFVERPKKQSIGVINGFKLFGKKYGLEIEIKFNEVKVISDNIFVFPTRISTNQIKKYFYKRMIL